jgi:hypothetical protein
MRDEERTHRIAGADHAPVWVQSSTTDGKACATCYEQALPAWVRRAQAGTLPVGGAQPVTGYMSNSGWVSDPDR